VLTRDKTLSSPNSEHYMEIDLRIRVGHLILREREPPDGAMNPFIDVCYYL
jgi:hypothetical protein